MALLGIDKHMKGTTYIYIHIDILDTINKYCDIIIVRYSNKYKYNQNSYQPANIFRIIFSLKFYFIRIWDKEK